MKWYVKKPAALLLAAVMASLGAAIPANAAEYNDFDYITSHVNTYVPQELQINRPSGNITTSASSYYIMGSSDPNLALYCNGEEVSGRGVFGSFGLFVSLSSGANTFTFTQGNSSQTITITRGSGGSGSVATTTTLTKAFPTYDSAYESGDTVTISCVAPAGASVSASVNGSTISLRQVAAAQTGVPATFKGEYTIPGVSGTQNLGHVTYYMQYNGSSKTYTSSGNLYASGGDLLVQVKDTSATLFASNEGNTTIVGTAKIGAVDEVVDQDDTMYQLSMGGWVNKDSVTPVTSSISAYNEVSNVAFEQLSGGERWTLTGTGTPLTTASRSNDTLTINLHHTFGVGDLPVENSQLFSGCTVTEDSDGTTVEFDIIDPSYLWGYVVEYNDDGNIEIYCKYPPTLSSGSQPLQGITIALDAGHGGPDPGALGMAQTNGPTESDITYNTAVALQKRLESLGATVIFNAPKSETKSDYVYRMQPALDQKADLYLSLHCNSIATTSNGLKAGGTEVYYYESNGKNFASTMANYISSYTNRSNRGGKWSYYRVTLNSCAPSVLVEMGFMTNPVEYDSMCSRNGIYNTVNGISDGILAYLA